MQLQLNLLAHEKKQMLAMRKRRHFFAAQGLIVWALILLYAGILWSIGALLDFRVSTIIAENTLTDKREYSVEEFELSDAFVRETNARIKTLSELQQKHLVWSNALDALATSMPEGILLDSLVTLGRKMSLSGSAVTRDDLLLFQKKLNESDCFQNANVPLSDLFLQKEVVFQLDVEVRYECLSPKNL